MSSFAQWRNAFVKSGNVRQATWLCGDQPILIEEIITTIKNTLHPQSWNFFPLAVGEESEREIWALMDQLPVEPDKKRLVIVRNAEQLKNPEKIIEWIKNRSYNPLTYVIFVSNDASLPREEAVDRWDKPEVVDYIKALQTGAKGHTIECRQFSQSSVNVAAAWVMDKAPLKLPVAQYLLEHTNFDLRLVRDLCTKLRLYDGEITKGVINEMVTEQPALDFEEALLALDKKTALLSIRSIPEEDYSRIIGSLDEWLSFASSVHEKQKEHKSNSEIAQEVGKRRFLLPSLLPVVKHYNERRVANIRSALALVDEAYQKGIRSSLLEVIVALW